MVQLFKFKEPYDLSQHTLIIPTVSVGNVPQLTVDLLITTWKLKKVATIWHPAIVAAVGIDPYYETKEICTAFELFANPEKKVAAIQIRSGLEFRLVTKFMDDLKTGLEQFKLEKVIVLSSGFDYELRVISTEKFYYMSNQDVKKIMDTNKIKPIETDVTGKPYINGGGFTIVLYNTISQSFKTTLLTKLVSEGDNIPDAIITLETLCKLENLKFNQQELVFPSSWKYVFGGPPPKSIY